jgi:hypothetical protein
MTLGQFLVLYLMAGAGVAAAVYVASASKSTPRGLQVAMALVFWPLFLPLLLCRAHGTEETLAASDAEPANDELALLIAQVDAELRGAWQSLDGWAEDVLAREKDRLGELRRVWSAQAERIREMDRLLSGSPDGPLTPQHSADVLAQRLRISQNVIEQNRERLRQIRERTHQDLVSSLAWVRELVSMIHLAKFTGAPASRAEELVAQVAAAVEGLSAMNWQDEEPFTDGNLVAPTEPWGR